MVSDHSFQVHANDGLGPKLGNTARGKTSYFIPEKRLHHASATGRSLQPILLVCYHNPFTTDRATKPIQEQLGAWLVPSATRSAIFGAIMKRAFLLPILTTLLASSTLGQIATLSNGSLTVLEGTTVRFVGPMTFAIAAGATVENNGVIDLGSEATLVEPVGGPIIGSGTERSITSNGGPFTSETPGGLGLTMSSAVAASPVEVVRGHVPFELPEGDLGIARWYELNSISGSDLEVTMRYDATELNGLLADQLSAFRSNSESGPWSIMITDNDPVQYSLSASYAYPWGLQTAFDQDVITSSQTLVVADGFSVWPTMVIDVLHITSLNGSPIATLEVLDGLGRAVPFDRMNNSVDQSTVGCTGLGAGAYFLRVNGNRVFKFRKA